jgi:transcriptional regulator with XRE-family HTH domain
MQLQNGREMSASADASGDGPGPVDRHVGTRIRLRRKEVGMSQEQLARRIGVSFQQVQKYERGANRVSASKLFEIAVALEASPAVFFAGLAGAAPRGDPSAHEAFLFSQEGRRLAQTFPQLTLIERRRIVALVRALAEPADQAPAQEA